MNAQFLYASQECLRSAIASVRAHKMRSFLTVLGVIIGISSVHLLRTFIEAGYVGTEKSNYTETGIILQTVIHSVFILSAIGIAFVDRMSQTNEA